MGAVSTSMTINAPAAVMLAFYVVAAERQGVPAGAAGRHDPDRHPQGVHRPEGVVLPDRPGDAAGHGHGRVLLARGCRAGTRSRSRGYHIREAGSTAAAGAGVHAQGRVHLRGAARSSAASTWTSSRRGCRFFFNAHIDFFEEIAKYRAARRIWARELRDTYGARDERSPADALPQPDGGRVADRAAAAQQHRAHGDRGARRRCSAAPSRCTPTASTRRSRCRPRRPCGWRCARSRSSPTRPA